ncbi:DUF1311 domain-containing protein [Mucilaginibacter sp. UR6-1]|uniref:lysozyme inhibitor LprI family protein n=1 Tax=Mucilaginibacter sp. UR6-1 TaxID=1435643 RepID=UPI001E296CE3|nr:lysozyme inhibitor LprI family protein [Mucilaginibacter sp. UR6-1]MCC8410302.1 DUF1311 domain-containing protein [Mucilaginibacter sp. UR6-1]
MKPIQTKILLAFAVMLFAISFNSYGQTQANMNADAYSTWKNADKELNVVYKQILKKYVGQTTFLNNLKKAQRLWIQLRDAELAVKYPDGKDFGSVGPMCKSSYLEKLTRDRTKLLRAWLTKAPEGDVCNGTTGAF